MHHRQNNAIWSPIALAIGEKTAKAVLLRVRCNNSTQDYAGESVIRKWYCAICIIFLRQSYYKIEMLLAKFNVRGVFYFVIL